MEKIIFIIVFALTLYLSINVIQKFSIKFDLLSEIINEFKLSYVKDIVITNTTICPKDYENIIINTYWPGSYKGCGCKNDDKSNFSFYPNYCPKIKECYSVEETKRKDFTFWRGKNICLKRSNIEYPKMNVVKKSNFIDENNNEQLICSNSTHKNCGIIDGKNHYLCLERDKECPINDIKFVKIEEKLVEADNKPFNKTNSKRENVYLDDYIKYNSEKQEIRFNSGFKIYTKKDQENVRKLYNEKIEEEEKNLSGKEISFEINEPDKINYNISHVKDRYKKKGENDLKFTYAKSFEDFKNEKQFEFNVAKLNIMEQDSNKKFIHYSKSEDYKNISLRLLQNTLVKFTNASFTKHNNIDNPFNDSLYNSNSTLFNVEGFYTLNLSDNYQLIFSKNEMTQKDIINKRIKKIPVFFRTQSVNPCLDSLKIPSQEYFFPLMKNKFDFMCDLSLNKTEIIDEALNVLDSLSLSEFFRYNNYHKEIENVVRPFNIDLNKKQIYLFYRNYLAWSSKCIANSPESLQSFTRIEENINHLLIMNILHSFISIGGIIALGIFACFLSQYFELFFKFVNLGFCIFNLIFPIQIISNSNWIINLFTDEDGVFCGDSTLNILLIEFSNSCLEMQNSYIWILIITIVYSFIYIYMLYTWIKPFHQEYQNKFKSYMSIK